MAWENVGLYRGRGQCRFQGPTVSLLSGGELYFNQLAVKGFALKPGRVNLLVDREMMKVGVDMGSQGDWTMFEGGYSSIRMCFRGIIKQLGITLPKKGEKVYATLSKEDGMVVFSYKDWVKV